MEILREKEFNVCFDVDDETPVSIEGRYIRADWANIGEGFCGDFNPDDPNDDNLLRFYIYSHELDDEGNWILDSDWTDVEDASYCTYVSAKERPHVLFELLFVIFQRYNAVLSCDPYASVKKLGEELSYISSDHLKVCF